MSWLKPVLDILGKFRTFFAWLAGYWQGRKVEKLRQENDWLKAKADYEKDRNERQQKVLNKWDRIRQERRLRLINHAHQPQQLRPDEEVSEPVLDLGSGSELRLDRE